MPPPVIMVHGAFCQGWAFDAFKAPFEAAGHRCAAPNLPGHGGRGETVSGLSTSDYAAAIVTLIESSTEPPILLGHSLGGLVAQMAAQKAQVRAMILLTPSAPWGVSGGSMEEAAAAIGLMSLGAYWAQAIEPDRATFDTYSVNRMAPEDRAQAFTRLVPESGRALFETINWWLDPFMTTSVGTARGSPPVLVLAGGRDQIHPASVIRQSAERCGATLQVYPDMGHWLIGEPGYDRVAADCLEWLQGAVSAAA